MNVSLVSLTQSLIKNERGEQLNPEELIVYIARVSNPGNQMNTETSNKLIAYLMKNKHWSPLEMVDFTMEIVTSRAIAAQILRHWSFSFQEFSQRYAKVTEMEPIQLRLQAQSNRQSSLEECNPILKNNSSAMDAINDYLQAGQSLYNQLLDADVAKECARMILPLTIGTKIYMKGSVREWVHYLTTRCDSHTQLEHREIALAIQQHFITLFPNISSGLNWISDANG
jgi:thymidylate synthase (FAD)